MVSFQTVADLVQAEILGGALKPGDRLLAQREFAFRHNIAASTASRVYAELVRRGLVVGETGRGTFVRDTPARPEPALVEPTRLPVDLEMIFSMPPGCEALLSRSFGRWASSPAFGAALRPMGAAGTHGMRELASNFLARGSWKPDPSGILFAGNGRQAIAATLSALATPGARVGVEAITYPVVKGIAARLGIILVPLPLDEEGLVPEAVAEAHRAKGLAAVYLQPTLQSPLGCSMGAARRRAWANMLSETGLTAIEDGIYSFLALGEMPLASLVPERVVFLDSLSKRVSPGASLGLLVAPKAMTGSLATAIRAGAWMAASLSCAVGAHWMGCRDAAIVSERKRTDALARQAIAHELLGPSGLQSDRRAFHAWLPLPDAVRAESFVARALRHGIAVTAGSAFAVGHGHSPAGVRLAFGAPDRATLIASLRTLRDLLESDVERAVE